MDSETWGTAIGKQNSWKLEGFEFLSTAMLMASHVNASDFDASPTKGLVCHCELEDGTSQFIFLQADQNGAASIDHSLSFSTKEYVEIICSCNGLLLLSTLGEKHQEYHVFNPLTKDCFTLPPPCIELGVIIRSGLAFNGQNYLVVLVHAEMSDVIDRDLELEIFSSESGSWRRHRPINLSLPFSFPQMEFPQLNPLPLFSNGAIHWEIEGHLLLYQVNNDHCELIELPNRPQDDCFALPYRRCLWESGGRVQYTYADETGVHTWDLLHTQDHDRYLSFGSYNQEKFRWGLVRNVPHKRLNLKLEPESFLSSWSYASPLAYIEAFQTMYLQLPGGSISYNTETGVIKKACTFTPPGRDFNCCSFLPFDYAGNPNLQTATRPMEAVPVNLPVTEMVNSVSFRNE